MTTWIKGLRASKDGSTSYTVFIDPVSIFEIRKVRKYVDDRLVETENFIVLYGSTALEAHVKADAPGLDEFLDKYRIGEEFPV